MGDASGSLAVDSVTSEQLNNAETRRLLDTIDSLRDLSISGIVDLPQIIVVGDQCSGKSSVLEAISRVHFPVSDGICTRFPIELVLRRAPRESTDLRIRFASESLVAGRTFSRTRTPFQESGFHRSELPAIINRAKEHMGLGDGKTTGFSRDVLRVEIAGPDIPSLTLVDLPGIFHSGVSSQPQEWKPVVDDMVESYMRQRNSIILMVVSADISLSKHAILDKAARFDVARERTIGVITKVDLCPGSNLEDEYIRLARGQEPNHQLRLGWHILRNRGPKEPEGDSDQRDAEEERFLKTGAWSSLPLSSRGVDSLRKNLGATLLRHIKSSLPELIRDIDDNLQTRQTRLTKLGTTRTNPNEMRDYLLDVSANFHRLAEHAIEGRYSDPFFASPTVQETSRIKFRKLRALLRNLNRAFDITMRNKGARYQIEWEKEQDVDDTKRGADAEEPNVIVEVPDYLQPFLRLYDFPDPTPKSESMVNARIERIASASQGVEFPGLPNSDLIMQLFRDHAEPWRRIAECHLDIVVERTRLFVYHLFDYVLEDDKQTRDAILAECVDPAFEAMTETLKNKLTEILRPFTSGHGLPLETEFRTGLSKRKLNRIAAQIVNLMNQRDSVTYNTSSYQLMKYEDVRDIILEANSSMFSDFGTDIVIDMMLTHYEMSLRTFTDNVIHLVIENCLVSNLPNIFSTKVVTQMSDDILRRLAEESDEVKLERGQLTDEIEKLRLGLQNCQRSRPRDFSELPDNFIELAPRRDAGKKKIRVKLPFVQYAKTEQPESPFAQVASTKIDFTTGMKQGQNVALSNGKAPAVAIDGETNVKKDDGKTTIKWEPSLFGSSKSLFGSSRSGSSTAAESSKNNSTPVAGSSNSAQPSTTEPKKTAQPPFMGSSMNNIPPAGSLFGSAKTPVANISAFGSTATTATPVTLFGSVSVSQTSVPISQTSVPKPSFGLASTTASTAAAPAFGSVPSTANRTVFGSPLPPASAFGSLSAFGKLAPVPATKTPASTSAFGSIPTSTVPAAAFGSVPTSQAPAPKPSLFGSTTTAPAVSNSMFGSTPVSQPPVSKPAFGANMVPQSSSVSGTSFGNTPPPATTSTTVRPSPGGLFGASAAAPSQPSGGLFDAAKSPSPSPNSGSGST